MIARYPVVLASASPRRKALLARVFAEFETVATDVDESSETLPLEDRAAQLALAKARVVRNESAIIIGADTIVGLGDIALGKPSTKTEAAQMLSRLSNTTHRVITGVALVWPSGETAFVDVATVTFRQLSEAEIAAYVQTGEPMDKAGAYAIQGAAAGFATSLVGDVDTVIGLPVARLAQELRDCGLAEPME